MAKGSKTSAAAPSAAPPALKELHWEVSSRKDFDKWPHAIKEDMAKALLALQKGERPQLETRPMPSIETGVFELKDGDRDTWYRLMYTGKYKNRIYVLHCFTKKSTKTPKSDLETTGKRLKDVKKRLMEEPKHGERTSTHHSRQRI